MNKYIVFGLGISGNATVKYLLENNNSVIALDDNQKSLSNLENEISRFPELKKNLQIGTNINEINWKEISALILAPGIPLYYPTPHKIVSAAREHLLKIICDIEILYSQNSASKFIGITGTNGKSTTTALTAHIFKEAKKESAVGGNIGVAALALPKLSDNGTYILEMSSYQLDLIIQTHFYIANLLNITPDHLARHKDMEGYIAAKKRIFMNQKSDDYAVIGIDNEYSRKVFDDLKNDSNFKAKLIPLSTKKILEDGVSMINGTLYNNLEGENSQFDLRNLPFLKGEHNAQNIVAAFANSFLSQINEHEIIRAIKSFKGLDHRMQFIKKIGDIAFINDSKATNAESTENALKSYNHIYWILGGQAKEGGINNLTSYFKKITKAYLIGAATEEFAAVLEKNKVQFEKCGNLENAFFKALEDAKKDSEIEKNILLSPACASLDQWKNFEERGNYFCKLVKKS